MNKQNWRKGIVLGLGLWMLAGAAPGVADQLSAEKAAREALATAERTFGPEHPDTAQSLKNLASLLQAQGKFAEAEPLYRRALATCEKALGLDQGQPLHLARAHPYFWASFVTVGD